MLFGRKLTFVQIYALFWVKQFWIKPCLCIFFFLFTYLIFTERIFLIHPRQPTSSFFSSFKDPPPLIHQRWMMCRIILNLSLSNFWDFGKPKTSLLYMFLVFLVIFFFGVFQYFSLSFCIRFYQFFFIVFLQQFLDFLKSLVVTTVSKTCQLFLRSTPTPDPPPPLTPLKINKGSPVGEPGGLNEEGELMSLTLKV